MAEEPVDFVLKLSLEFAKGWMLEDEESSKSLLILTGFHYLCEEMDVVDGPTKDESQLFELVHVEDMRKLGKSYLLIITWEFHSWEGDLTLLQIIVNCFIEVLAHISLHYDWEVVSEPLTLTACVES